MRVAIIGDGRMGRAIAGLAAERAERGIDVVAIIGLEGNAHGAGITRERLAGADVAIEFTEPAAAADNALACVAADVPVVVGTTGWYDRLPQVEAAVAASDGALLWAPNFSTGVVLFRALLAWAGPLFAGSGFAARIVETHHGAKQDAPSGTALSLARAFGAAADAPPEITSIRVGHVPGTHELMLDGPFEQIRLVHEARDRRVFADGALRAAAWLQGRRGVFTMNDVLGIGTEGEA